MNNEAVKHPKGLPNKVKIGWRDYSINIWNPIEAQQKGRYGEIRHFTREIYIDLTYGMRNAACTLLHELLHGVATMWNFPDHAEDKEESVVELFADGLTTVWRDNPELMAWIAYHIINGDG